MESIGLIIGVIQSAREIIENYRDETGSKDLILSCASLEWVENELFDLWEGQANS